MRVGKLRDLIDIQLRSTAKDAAGEQVDHWLSIGYRRAEIVHLSGKEFITAMGVGSELTTKINLRSDQLTKQITGKFRIVDRIDGTIFDVQSAIPHATNKQFIECLCKSND